MRDTAEPECLPEDTVSWQIVFGGRGFITLKIRYEDGGATESHACSDITMSADGRITYVLIDL